MLDIDIRPYKGILFVKLSGKLNKTTKEKLNKEVVLFQKQVGIKNIVFNIENLKEIDSFGKYEIENSLGLCQTNKGKSYICLGKNKKIKNIFPDKNLITDETSAINLINS